MNRFQNNEEISVYVCRGDVCNRVSLGVNPPNKNLQNRFRENYGDEPIEYISLDSIATRNFMGWMQLNNPVTIISKSQQLTVENKTLFVVGVLIVEGKLINLSRITTNTDSKVIISEGGKFCNHGSIETASGEIEVHGKFLNKSNVDLSDTKLTVAGVFYNDSNFMYNIATLNILPSGEFINYSGGGVVNRNKDGISDMEIVGKNITYTNEQCQVNCDSL
jgi:hypothetical protein